MGMGETIVYRLYIGVTYHNWSILIAFVKISAYIFSISALVIFYLFVVPYCIGFNPFRTDDPFA